MTATVRVDPILDELERMLGDVWAAWKPVPVTGGLGMDLDVHETKDEQVIKADLPGIVRDNLHITLEEGTLRIEADKKEEKTEDGETWYMRERSFGKYSRHRAALPRSGREDLGHPGQGSTRDQVAQGRGNQTQANRNRSAVGAVTNL
jgi:HSP20 family protein